MVTLVFAFYNGFLGIYHDSMWNGTICAYYLMLSLLRGLIIDSAKRINRGEIEETSRDKAFLAISSLLLILNISLIIPVSIMVRQQKPVRLTMIPAIAMAAYTTYKTIMASINLGRRKVSSNSLILLLLTISFIDALVSILTIQNTLIMVKSNGGDLGMLPLTAITSGCIWGLILVLSVSTIVKGIKQDKS